MSILAFEFITIDLFGWARHLSVLSFGLVLADFIMSLWSFHISTANIKCKLQELCKCSRDQWTPMLQRTKSKPVLGLRLDRENRSISKQYYLEILICLKWQKFIFKWMPRMGFSGVTKTPCGVNNFTGWTSIHVATHTHTRTHARTHARAHTHTV